VLQGYVWGWHWDGTGVRCRVKAGMALVLWCCVVLCEIEGMAPVT